VLCLHLCEHFGYVLRIVHRVVEAELADSNTERYLVEIRCNLQLPMQNHGITAKSSDVPFLPFQSGCEAQIQMVI